MDALGLEDKGLKFLSLAPEEALCPFQGDAMSWEDSVLPPRSLIK